MCSLCTTDGLVSTSATKNINFETLPGGVTAVTDTATANLALTIGNKNEAPSFQKTIYAISGLEGPVNMSSAYSPFYNYNVFTIAFS